MRITHVPYLTASGPWRAGYDLEGLDSKSRINAMVNKCRIGGDPRNGRRDATDRTLNILLNFFRIMIRVSV